MIGTRVTETYSLQIEFKMTYEFDDLDLIYKASKTCAKLVNWSRLQNCSFVDWQSQNKVLDDKLGKEFRLSH